MKRPTNTINPALNKYFIKSNIDEPNISNLDLRYVIFLIFNILLSTNNKSAVPYIFIFLFLLTSPTRFPLEIITSDSGLISCFFPFIII